MGFSEGEKVEFSKKWKNQARIESKMRVKSDLFGDGSSMFFEKSVKIEFFLNSIVISIKRQP
jgi:hypothetical protein